jgi:hypothetical protein
MVPVSVLFTPKFVIKLSKLIGLGSGIQGQKGTGSTTLTGTTLIRAYLEHGRAYLEHGRAYLEHGRAYLEHGRAYLEHGRAYLGRGRAWPRAGAAW